MSDDKPIKSVLFVCNMNQIRSPMAEYLLRNMAGEKIYTQSAGTIGGNNDTFMQSVMAEKSIDVSSHEPETLEELEDTYVDLVVTLTTNAKEKVESFFKDQSVEIEYWDIANPSGITGKREDILNAYRETRDELEKRIRKRFI